MGGVRFRKEVVVWCITSLGLFPLLPAGCCPLSLFSVFSLLRNLCFPSRTTSGDFLVVKVYESGLRLRV
jgi:hypothetical protein